MNSEDHKKNAIQLESFEDILESIGTSKPWNILVFVLSAAVALMTPMQVLSSGFLGKIPAHWCQVTELKEANWTQTQIRTFADPLNLSCLMVNYNYSRASELGFEQAMANPSKVGGGEKNISCMARDFDSSVNSIVTEWDLVCDRLPIYSSAAAAPQYGMLIGSIIAGYLSDRIGRQRLMFASILSFIPMGLLVCFSVNPVMYIITRILVTMFGFGMYLSGFVLAMELCTTQIRSIVISYYSIPWGLGYMLTAIIAKFISDWRYLQAAYTLPAFLLVINLIVVLESPRWLAKQGRYQDCLTVLKKMATRNKISLPSDDEMLTILEKVSPPPISNDSSESAKNRLNKFYGTWIKPQLIVRTPLVFFVWFSVALVYYGVSLGATTFGIDEFTFVFVGGSLELVANLLLYPAIKFIGRRASLVGTFAITGVSLIGVSIMQSMGYDGSFMALGWLSYTGKFTITAAFNLIYIVTGELFPTSLRSLVIGEASVSARVGSISSPYINVLLGNKIAWLPAALFGAFSLMAAGVSIAIPETKTTSLDETDECHDNEAFS